ncbi:MAG: AAA family ATPase [Phycisphaerae bacterium]
MSELRILLFDNVRSDDERLSEAFEQLEDVSIVGTSSTWETLSEHLLRKDTDVVAVNLDCSGGLDVVQKVTRHSPDCGIVGISTNTEALFIIKAMRAGCGQFVCAPVDQDDLVGALQRVRPAKAKSSHASRHICLVGSSGGAGATTVACNLAMELAHLTGDKIALVDLNLEYGDVASNFDCTPKYTIADMAGGGIDLDEETLRAGLHELPSGVSIIARPNQVDEAREVMPDGVDLMLRLLGDSFPFVVVDLPRTFSFLSTVALGRADYVLIITQLSVPAIRNATRVYEALLQLGAEQECLQFVINRYNADFERITLKEVEEHFRRPVFAVIPNDYKYVSASLDFGHPLGANAPANKCRAAIQEIAKKLAPEFAKAPESTKSEDGFLGKLLGRRQKTAKG